MPTPKWKRKQKERRKMYLRKKEMKSTIAQHIGPEKSCRARVSKESAQNNDWKFFEKRGEVSNQGSKQLETNGKPNSPQNWSINSTNRDVPRGHGLWSAAAMHLIRREIPRVAYSPKKPFIFYGHHDMSWWPQNLGAADGTDKINCRRTQ